jgi:hypothetical protein
MRYVWHIAYRRERIGIYSVLLGKPERKEQLGRSGRRWECNIKLYLQELG